MRTYWFICGLILLLAAGALAGRLHWGDALQPADASYASQYAENLSAGCAQGSRPAVAGASLNRTTHRTPGGVPYRVITPRNYDARHAHPLLLVYAPAGIGMGLSERFAGLTRVATAAGFVLVYVSSIRLNPAAVTELATVPAAVAAHWCIDPARIYAAGHSDGGTVAQALAILPEHQGTIRAIVASGAGWRAGDFAAQACPAPMPVLILHGADDSHFPHYGRDAARWWSACNRCANEAPEDTVRMQADGCHLYTGCAADTVYCEPAFTHWRWAGEPQQILSFLARHAGISQPDTAQ